MVIDSTFLCLGLFAVVNGCGELQLSNCLIKKCLFLFPSTSWTGTWQDLSLMMCSCGEELFLPGIIGLWSCWASGLGWKIHLFIFIFDFYFLFPAQGKAGELEWGRRERCGSGSVELRTLVAAAPRAGRGLWLLINWERHKKKGKKRERSEDKGGESWGAWGEALGMGMLRWGLRRGHCASCVWANLLCMPGQALILTAQGVCAVLEEEKAANFTILVHFLVVFFLIC